MTSLGRWIDCLQYHSARQCGRKSLKALDRRRCGGCSQRKRKRRIAIKEFRETRNAARAKWIVSVGKISEGVDIKHLRVCVYLTKIQAPLRWTQILGRVLRVEDDLEWDLQTAHFFQYDDGLEDIANEDGETEQQSVNMVFSETLYRRNGSPCRLGSKMKEETLVQTIPKRADTGDNS